MPFVVKSENKLVSDRWPSPIFKSDFDNLSGCMYHLRDGGPTCFDLLKKDWYDQDGNKTESVENIKFKDEFAEHVKNLLQSLLIASPVGKILFTTDYQFGPKDVEKNGPITFIEFWTLHDSGNIRMNASYLITRN